MISPAPTLPAGITGLTASEVAERVRRGETNHTEQVTSRPLSQIVWANIFTRFNGLLGALLVLVLLTGSYKNALFGIPLVINSLLGIAQEWHAKRKLDSLAVLHAPTALVLREGQAAELPSGEVVRGDLVALRPGDQVCADGTVLSGHNLELDESNLTGESDAVPKTDGDPVSSGTAVVAGSGWFRADQVGGQATAQQLAAEARQFTRAHSEVQHSTNVLLRWLTWVVAVALPVSIASQWWVVGSVGWREVVIRAAAGMVGLVPEGLVVLTTLAFLLAAVQLTRQQALVQELPAVEGLARVDVVCVDKTGTLTEGTIAMEQVTPLPGADQALVERILGALCHDEAGNQTAQAIAAVLPDPGLTVTDRVPFSSARKWSGGLVEGQPWLLGGPDVLAPDDVELQQQVSERADVGRRVLLLASVPHLPGPTDRPAGVVPAAVVELSEVVRDDAAATLDYFRSQGVRVVVISGDTPRTVAAVGHRVGLDVGTPVDARTLPTDQDQLAEVAERTTVFGRVTPAQKRALVRALQAKGHVVAMTGDGVNDVLALKDADVGIAMGNGAQATKAVAQLVLLDSRFAHLPSVVAEGRRVIGNVERVASLFVTKNAVSAVAILASAVFGLAYPFFPLQMTLVSTLAIGIPAFFLSLGPNRRRYLPGFLRRVLIISIPAGVAGGVAAFGVYAFLARGVRGDPQASTAALIALLTTSLWLLGCLARPYQAWKVGLLGAMVALAVFAFWLPLAQRKLDLVATPVAIGYGLVAGALGVVVIEIAYRVSRSQHPTTEAGHSSPAAGQLPATILGPGKDV